MVDIIIINFLLVKMMMEINIIIMEFRRLTRRKKLQMYYILEVVLMKTILVLFVQELWLQLLLSQIFLQFLQMII
jgi:hypothetical protein